MALPAAGIKAAIKALKKAKVKKEPSKDKPPKRFLGDPNKFNRSKKMAIGGSVDYSDTFDAKGNTQKTVKGTMLDEIDELKYLARNGTAKQKAEAKKYIKQKQAGIKAGEKLVQTKKSGRVYGRAIPTFEDASDVEGLGMGQKDRMDKYMRDQEILKKEQKRVKTNKAGGTIKKKAGGSVKKMKGGGMAMKYKHGGKVGKKCPRDGIARKGKTRA